MLYRSLFVAAFFSMDLDSYKAISAVLLFLVALGGSVLSRYASGFSPKLVRVCNAAAGGILVAVTLVHMLAESSEDMEGPGIRMARFLSGQADAEAFPLGFALCGIGFLTIVALEVFLPGGFEKESHHGHGHHEGEGDTSDSDSESELGDQEKFTVVKSKSWFGGLCAVVGLCVHSLIEGTATGASDDATDFTATFLAILCHKAFATFGAGSLLLNSVSNRAWWSLVTLLALCTPLGILLGRLLEGDFEGPGSAALICFAAGSLLSVAVYDMLMPSLLLGSAEWRRRSFMGSLLGFCAMSLLGIWS